MEKKKKFRFRRPTKKDKLTALELIGKHIEKYRILMIVMASIVLLAALAFSIYWQFDEFSAVNYFGERGVIIDNLYLVVHLSFLGLCLIIIGTLVLNLFKKIGTVALAILFHIYAFLILTLATLLSILDLKLELSPITFMMACALIAGLFMVEPRFFIFISFSYYVTIMIFQGVNHYHYFSNANYVENIIYFLAYVILTALISVRYYRVTRSEYEAKRKLEILTYYDELTGLLNERSYMAEIDRIAKGIEDGTLEEFAVVMMDVNNLKATNDAYGHHYGCHLIVECGHVLPTVFKHSLLYHVGGDEFIAIVYGEDYRNFEQVMEEFDKTFSYSLIQYEGHELIFSVARGYTKYQKGDRYQDVMQRADDLMYENKKMLKEKYNMKGR